MAIFFCKKLYGGREVYLYYIHILYDAHDSDQNKEKGKKKEENTQFTFFVMSQHKENLQAYYMIVARNFVAVLCH